MNLAFGSLTVEVGGLAGALFAGSEAAHPTMNARASPLLCGPHVTADSGSGLVHTAPGHGQEDWVAGRAVGLPVYVPVTPDGKFTPEAGPELEGQQACLSIRFLSVVLFAGLLV
jgi:isoleucyl-tRNA synthetase